MKTFKDNTGQDWPIDIDLELLEEISKDESVGVDVLAPLGKHQLIQPLMESLATDVRLGLSVLYRTCAKQAEKLNVDRKAFVNRMGGGIMGKIMLLWIKEYALQFPPEMSAPTIQQIEKAEMIQEAKKPTLLRQLDEELALSQQNSELEAEVERTQRMNKLKAERERLLSLLPKEDESLNGSSASTAPVTESSHSGNFANV